MLLVGGSNMGLKKFATILRNSPATTVTVMVPRMLPALRELAARHPRVQLHARPYTDENLTDQDFVFVATDDLALNRHVKAAAATRRILTNVTNTAEKCDFYLSSIIPTSDLKVTISTNGKSPTMGNRLRAVLEETLPGELHTLLQNMTANGSRAISIKKSSR